MRNVCTGLILLLFCIQVSDARDVFEVQGEGMASTSGGDAAQYKYEARASARVHALESLGVKVSARTYTDQTHVLDATVETAVKGYIVKDWVVDETVTGDIYTVLIKALVRLEMTEEEQLRRQRNLVVAVDVEEFVRHEQDQEPQENSERVLESMIKDALIHQGFQAYTVSDIQELMGLYTELNAHLDASLDARGLVGLTLAGVFVHGRVESRFTEKAPAVEDYFGQTQQGLFYRSYPKITASKPNGSPVPEGSFYKPEGIKAYQFRPERAAREALRKSGEEIVPALVKALSTEAQKQEVTFTVRIEGLPDLQRYRKYKQVLAKMRWVKSVEAGAFEPNKDAVYTVVYKEKEFLFVSQLHRVPHLKVVETGGFSIRVKYK